MLPPEMTEEEFVSTMDKSREKYLMYFPAGKRDVPLVVGLHTWSYERFNQIANLLPLCRDRGWALVLPEFRGPNLQSNPRAGQACGSQLAKQDIIDSVDSAVKKNSIDSGRIFLTGGSGGGHMSLLMAAHDPKRWLAVSAWVPITDLTIWHGQNPNYTQHIEACCGGPPGRKPAVDREYQQRSPITYLKELAQANLSVHHGRYDPSVPYTHTLRLAMEMEKLGAKKFFFDIFDGGHELRFDVAFRWFDSLIKSADKPENKLTA